MKTTQSGQFGVLMIGKTYNIADKFLNMIPKGSYDFTVAPWETAIDASKIKAAELEKTIVAKIKDYGNICEEIRLMESQLSLKKEIQAKLSIDIKERQELLKKVRGIKDDADAKGQDDTAQTGQDDTKTKEPKRKRARAKAKGNK